jgi:uncharacterized membrane protein YdfJ with MMPL/SSD domain
MRASNGGSSHGSLPLRRRRLDGADFSGDAGLAGIGARTVIVVGVLLAAAVVVLVALPFLREPVAADDRLDAPTESDQRRFALVEERDRALAALKELEFDHRTGKVDDADYRELVAPLRQAAAVALRALDSPQE